jgi:hemerythrin-like domain-containing protein
MPENPFTRRRCLTLLPAVGLGMSLPGRLLAADQDENDPEEDVTPAEDLMREHGVLKRVLLIYDEVRERIATKKSFPVEAVTSSAKIIQTFIEGYHEKLEEEHLFPRFRKKGKLVELVDTLEAQHKAGRRVTARIVTLTGSGVKADGDKQALSEAMRQFVRMYAPHEAREDTVLFPAIHDVVSKQEYDALGEDFEKKEHEILGKDGFEGMVEKIGEIEKALGIFDLRQFTPK